MKRLLLAVSTVLLVSGNVSAKGNATSDVAIKERIIKESIENYSGNCPCPYNTASNGSRCGKRSAYSRAGGYETICYPEDVTKEMIRDYKNRNK